MKLNNISDMVKGWFIGNITPVAYSTKNVEVAYKEYKAGDYDERHYHQIATEVTLIVYGKVQMEGNIYNKGDIITIEPYQITDFKALENSATVVVKIPGENNDKYLV